MKMWRIMEKTGLYTDEEIRSIIEEPTHRIIMLSGPTESGKTKLIRSLKSEEKLIISCESFEQAAMDMIRSDNDTFIEAMMSAFFFCPLLCIEDADIVLSGRSILQRRITDFLLEYVREHTAVFTGVSLNKRLYVIREGVERDKLLIIEHSDEQPV